MRLSIPLTGTVLVENPLVGDDNDPVRPIDIDLGNVSWTAMGIDLENEVMVIEVEPADTVDEPTGEVDGEGNPVYRLRPATAEEKAGFLQHAQGLIMEHTKDEPYEMSGCARLKRPFAGP